MPALDFLERSTPRTEIYNLGCGGDGHTIHEGYRPGCFVRAIHPRLAQAARAMSGASVAR